MNDGLDEIASILRRIEEQLNRLEEKEINVSSGFGWSGALFFFIGLLFAKYL